MCTASEKTLKVCFLDFEKKRTKRYKRTCVVSFKNHLITAVVNTHLPKVSTGKSPTSNILLRNVDTRNYATRL